MKSDINKLYQISQKDSKLIIGLMSGTSLDGLDIALCKINGVGRETKIELLDFKTLDYSKDFKDEVKKIFSIKMGDIELLTLLHSYIGKYHGSLVNEFLKSCNIKNEAVDLIASHGQTIYHAPKHLHKNKLYDNATLQIGDGDHLSYATGIITISDFRLKHISAGGEGAPLAVYGDYIIFSNKIENRILLNIGGIANFTWLPSENNELKNPCFSTDVGPGNTMMDAFVQKHFNIPFDKSGKIAGTGKANISLLQELMNHEFFTTKVPKTIGPELFNLDYLSWKINKLKSSISNEDVLATLNLFSATAIVNAIKTYVPEFVDTAIYLSGGGIHNSTLINNLKLLLPSTDFKNTEALNINPDAKEAILFALLANECVSGSGLHLRSSIGGMPDISMGKVSFPK
jgi:anhydro-N-acetylmuramic acid kinase